MSKLVLIGGLPGSGKTKYAEAVRSKLPGRTRIYEVSKYLSTRAKVTSHKYLQASEKLYTAVQGALYRKTPSIIVVKPFAYNWELDPYRRLSEAYQAELYFQDLFSAGYTIEQLAENCPSAPDLSFLRNMHKGWDDKTRRNLRPVSNLFIQ